MLTTAVSFPISLLIYGERLFLESPSNSLRNQRYIGLANNPSTIPIINKAISCIITASILFNIYNESVFASLNYILKDKFYQWLFKHGYPELSALTSSIKGNAEAFDWLIKRNFPQYAAFSNAVDGDEKAWVWLKENKYDLLFILAEASIGKKEAMEWLLKNQLQVFAVIAKRIIDIKNQLDFDYEDYHKIHF